MQALIITDQARTAQVFGNALARYFTPIQRMGLRDFRIAFRRQSGLRADLVFVDVLGSSTKCLAAIARVRALVPEAKVLVSVQRNMPNFQSLAEAIGAHGVVDAWGIHNDDFESLIAAVMGGSIIFFAAANA